jgi:ATP-dependent helicase YprA (DUF1998 family)
MSTQADLDLIQDAATIAYAVFRRTDFDEVDTHRNLDDEFASRIGAAAQTDTVASFAQRLADRWGVRSLGEEDGEVREVIHQYSDADAARRFLRVVRNHKALVVLEMREQYMDLGDDEDEDGETENTDDTET